MSFPDNPSKHWHAELRDGTNAPHDLGRSTEPIFTDSPTPPRFPTIWGGTVLVVIVFAACVIGLARLSVHVTHEAQQPDPADRSGGGIIDRFEVLRLWLPQTLAELAKRQSPLPVVQTHQGLQGVLELQGGKKLWFAMTVRGHQVNGKTVDITFIRWPYEDSSHFPELLDVLATAAGNSPCHHNADFSKASVHIIAEELLKCDPREVIAGLIGDPSPTVDPDRSR
jgi:hypothetical protein